MTRFKDFGSGSYKPEEAQELSFKLYDEEFLCTPAVQGKFLIDLISGAGDETSTSRNLEIITEFFKMYWKRNQTKDSRLCLKIRKRS